MELGREEAPVRPAPPAQRNRGHTCVRMFSGKCRAQARPGLRPPSRLDGPDTALQAVALTRARRAAPPFGRPPLGHSQWPFLPGGCAGQPASGRAQPRWAREGRWSGFPPSGSSHTLRGASSARPRGSTGLRDFLFNPNPTKLYIAPEWQPGLQESPRRTTRPSHRESARPARAGRAPPSAQTPATCPVLGGHARRHVCDETEGRRRPASPAGALHPR